MLFFGNINLCAQRNRILTSLVAMLQCCMNGVFDDQGADCWQGCVKQLCGIRDVESLGSMVDDCKVGLGLCVLLSSGIRLARLAGLETIDRTICLVRLD